MHACLEEMASRLLSGKYPWVPLTKGAYRKQLFKVRSHPDPSHVLITLQ